MFISGDDMFKKVLNKALNYYDDFDYLTNALCVFSKNIPYATGDESLIGTLELGICRHGYIRQRDFPCFP